MWIIFSLLASVFWGLTYIFNEKVYEKISVLTSLAVVSLFAFISMIITSYLTGHLNLDLHKIGSDKNLLFFVIAGTLTLIIAELFIGFSITAKSATLAGLIEISYPIFIALFAYLIFKENQLNLSTVVGGVMIFLGVIVIYFFNR
jgi:uncharacterized membrane protein